MGGIRQQPFFFSEPHWLKAGCRQDNRFASRLRSGRPNPDLPGLIEEQLVERMTRLPLAVEKEPETIDLELAKRDASLALQL
jgi:hypothetical protein